MPNSSTTMPTVRFPGLAWFIWVPLVFLLDQASKIGIINTLSFGESIKVLPGIQFTLAHNYGIAFSLFNKGGSLTQLALMATIIVICAIMGVWLAKTPRSDKWSGIALVFIFGGALGNLCDRIWHGYVVDFIDFYVGTWHWYTFNLADVFVTLGAICMLKTILFEKE